MKINLKSDTRHEHPDPTPVELPFGFHYESLADTIGKMVRLEHAKIKAQTPHVETFAESQDFGEDPDEFTSKHEMTEMQDELSPDWLTEKPEEPPEATPAPPADPPPLDPAPTPPPAS